MAERRRRILCALLIACLLPSLALAIQEGVVEDAPPVTLDWPKESGRLFGAWEDGLADIASSAQGVLSQRLGCPDGMRLYELSLSADVRARIGAADFASAPEEDMADDRIAAIFLYEDGRRQTWKASAVYSRETGELLYASKERYYEGIDAANAGAPSGLDETQIAAAVSDYMTGVIGVTEFVFRPEENAQGADRMARVVSLPGGTRYELHIGKTSGEVIAVHMNDAPPADYFAQDTLRLSQARRVLIDVLACPWEMVFSHGAEHVQLKREYDDLGNRTCADSAAFHHAKTFVFTHEKDGLYYAQATIDAGSGKILFAERIEDNRAPQHRAKNLTDETRRSTLTAYLEETLGHADYEWIGDLETVGETTRQRVHLADGTMLGLYLSETTGRALRAQVYGLKGGEE